MVMPPLKMVQYVLLILLAPVALHFKTLLVVADNIVQENLFVLRSAVQKLEHNTSSILIKLYTKTPALVSGGFDKSID